MLLIISDLHLTDGTISGETIDAKAFRILKNRIKDMAYDASFRIKNDKPIYLPIDSIEIILLGDILDVIRSDKWYSTDPKTDVKPWDDYQSALLFDKVDQISDGILENNKHSLEVFKELSDGVEIPAEMRFMEASDRWENVMKGNNSKIPVSIYYMVGNHDWVYHIPDTKDTKYRALREKIIKNLGLANKPEDVFPHLIEDDRIPATNQTVQAIRSIFSQYKVQATHGDIFDKINCPPQSSDPNEDRRLGSSLGDAIVIEILNRIPAEIDTVLKSNGVSEDIRKLMNIDLRELDNIRPYAFIPFWIKLFLEKHKEHLSTGVAGEIIAAMCKIFIDFTKNESLSKYLHRSHHRLAFLAGWLIRLGVSIDFISSVLGWYKHDLEAQKDSYADSMIEYSLLFKNEVPRFFVAGHTHYQELVPIREGQTYFNTGTWRNIHDISRDDHSDSSFFTYKVMTYVAFFKEDINKGDERNGKAFEFWNGALET